MTKIYENALTEVYEVLNYLEYESYKKIPVEIIEAIEENMNMEYSFVIDENLPFLEQSLLEESKAILFNLYRDYLTTPERRSKIIEYQNEELQILEEEKREKYNPDTLFEQEMEENFIEQEMENESEEQLQEDKSLIVYKEHWYHKFISFVKKIFNK